MFSLIGNSGDDKHPDAHACRLKLSLATRYEKDLMRWDQAQCPWSVSDEYTGYDKR